MGSSNQKKDDISASYEKQRNLKLILFNIAMAAAAIVIFSPGFCDLADKSVAAALGIGAIMFFAFMSINYTLLLSTPKMESEKVTDLKSCKRELCDGIQTEAQYRGWLKTALEQVERFEKQEAALKSILPDKDNNPYLTINEDVKNGLMANCKRIMKRIAISNSTDMWSKNDHLEYLKNVLNNNEQMLSQYEQLLVEISQIGDATEMQNLNLQTYTDALRELREDSEFKQFETLKNQSANQTGMRR